MNTNKPEDGWICAACGAVYPRGGIDCVMSDEGEGPHEWEEPEEPIPPKDLPFYEAVARHLEQGAEER